MKTALLWTIKNIMQDLVRILRSPLTLYNLCLTNRITHGTFFLVIDTYFKHTKEIFSVLNPKDDYLVWDFFESDKTRVTTKDFVCVKYYPYENYFTLDSNELEEFLVFNCDKENMQDFKKTFYYYMSGLTNSFSKSTSTLSVSG